MEITKISKGCAAGFTLGSGNLAVYLTEDGKTWQEASSLETKYSNYSANDVLVLNTRAIFIVGSTSSGGGFLLWSFNGGTEWSNKEFPTPISHIAITGKQIWCSGEKCMVYKSDSYVEQDWQVFDLNKISGVAKEMNMQGISCVAKDEIYTVGNISTNENGVIYKTSDGGKTWRNIEVPPPSTGKKLSFIGVVAVNENLVYCHGGIGLLMKWDGEQWTYLQEPSGSDGHDVNGLFVVNENDLWFACDFSVRRILNGKTHIIPCDRKGSFMTGIYVWGSFVWASGITGAGSPVPGILTYSDNLGEEGSWNVIAERNFWKVSLYAERV